MGRRIRLALLLALLALGGAITIAVYIAAVDEEDSTDSAAGSPRLRDMEPDDRARFLAAIERGDLADDETTAYMAANFEDNIAQGQGFGSILALDAASVTLESMFGGESWSADLPSNVLAYRDNVIIDVDDLRIGEVVEVSTRSTPPLIISFAAPIRSIR